MATTEDRRRALIERYKEGPDVVRRALGGLTDRDLDRRPAPDEWSAREVVHHLADSEMTSAIRVRLLLAHDRPTLGAYDETAFVRRLHYDRPIEASFEAFRAARATTAEILQRLSEDDWKRAGTHSELGPYGVELWLGIYATHAHDHARQILRAAGKAEPSPPAGGGSADVSR